MVEDLVVGEDDVWFGGTAVVAVGWELWPKIMCMASVNEFVNHGSSMVVVMWSMFPKHGCLALMSPMKKTGCFLLNSLWYSPYSRRGCLRGMYSMTIVIFSCLVSIVAAMRSVSKSSSILYAMSFLMAMAVPLCGESSKFFW